MRNYLDLLGIHRGSNREERLNSIEAAEHSLEADYASDTASILADDTRYRHYRRLHLQYDAMAAAIANGSPQQDSNSWTKRLVEFSPDANELPE